MKEKKGFTLIELIIVIVILGILGAIAVPRFAGLSKEAKISAIKGLAGSINGAAVITHGKWLINGGSTVTMEDGTEVTMNNAYPTEASGGIDNAVDYDTEKYYFDGATDDTGPVSIDNSSDDAYFSYGTSSDPDCAAYYADNGTAFKVGTRTSGCE